MKEDYSYTKEHSLVQIYERALFILSKESYASALYRERVRSRIPAKEPYVSAKRALNFLKYQRALHSLQRTLRVHTILREREILNSRKRALCFCQKSPEFLQIPKSTAFSPKNPTRPHYTEREGDPEFPQKSPVDTQKSPTLMRKSPGCPDCVCCPHCVCIYIGPWGSVYKNLSYIVCKSLSYVLCIREAI